MCVACGDDAMVSLQGWEFDDSEWLTGFVLWCGMALLIITSWWPIRRLFFEVFLYL